MSTYYDTDSDGYLSYDEVEGVDKIVPLSVYIGINDTISDLTGIEYFVNATTLYAATIGLERIDVSALDKLETLEVQGNNLTELDVSNNSALTLLKCRGNANLSEINLPSSLVELQCDGCALTSLDLSKCTKLETLNCYNNELTALDLSNNTSLSFLSCSNNHITSLDLSSCPELDGKVMSSNVGGQTTVASAYYDESENVIYVPFEVDDYTKISSSNIYDPNIYDEDEDEDEDEEDLLPFTGYDADRQAFILTEEDYDTIINTGIVYMYNLSLSDSNADMDVTITIEKDFYRVRFYTSDSAEEPYEVQFVVSGGDATEPELSDTATCLMWTHDGKNITEDTDIYLYMNDSHSCEITNFDSDTGTVTFTCSICGFTEDVRFIDYVNNPEPEVNDYFELLDFNDDGNVTSSDYAVLIDMFS